MALFLCQAEGKTWQVSSSRTVPPLHSFFSLHFFKTVIAGIRQPGNWVLLSLVYRPATFFLKRKSYRG